jgi:hypothetical protein
MITADLTGNLGNNMWQYAITRTVAERCGYKFGFNRNPSHDYLGGAEQMDFMLIDYGVEHHANWKEFAPGIDKEWVEKRIDVEGHWYYPFQYDVFMVEDNTRLVIDCCQNPTYVIKEEVRNWFTIKPELEEQYKNSLIDILGNHTCVINLRGRSEYLHWNILLPQDYWNKAIYYMQSVDPKVEFVVITDDIQYANSIFPYPAYHFSIGCDYYAVNHAKYLILSNSSFGLFPAWLNENCNFVLAPKYWGGYNFGFWLSSEIYNFP